MRQMAGRRQHFVMTLDLHVLDIGAQFAPQPVDHRQGCRIGLLQRRENHFVSTEQLGIGGFYPALLGSGNRMPGNEACRHAAKRLGRGAHHIALGAADVRQDRPAQLHACQQRQQFFHGQDRYRQLNHIGADTGSSEIVFTTIHHPQLDRQLSRLRIKIDPHHFTAQPAFTQALGKGSTNQAETDHHQATDHRYSRLHGNHINHEPGPCSAPRGSACFPPAGQW
ncbi:hypothetical protein D3C78_1278200 [compost metagenome]